MLLDVADSKQELDAMELQKLIDAASAVAGSDYKLAQRLEVTRALVSGWRHGKPCSLDAVADMAAIAGLPVKEVVAEALIERNAGTPRGERLAKAMGKALAGVVGTLCIYGTSAQFAPAAACEPDARMHRLTNWMRRIMEMLNRHRTVYIHGA